MPTEKIANLRIAFLGKVCQVKELLSNEEIKQVFNRIQKNATPEECEEREEIVFQSENPVELIRHTIPAPGPLYISRCLKQRLEVDWEWFETECPDVFVFKTVERLELKKYLPDLKIECSEEILKQTKTDCRFVLLTSDRHWEQLCSRITSPRHLIRFDTSSGQRFVLEASTGEVNNFSQYLNWGCRPTISLGSISESELVRKTVEQDVKGVCICGLPGTGKSLLLASMARQAAEEYRESAIVAFIQFRHLNIHKQSVCDTILEYISTSVLAKYLLAALVQTRPIKWFLFFDDLDEMRNRKGLGRETDFLWDIVNTIPTAKLFVACHPQEHQTLVRECQAISVDILPFDTFSQVHVLTSVWRQKYPVVQDSTGFEEYAKTCLKRLEALGTKEKEVAGVPLRCKLIAEMFAHEASLYAEGKKHLSQEVDCSSKPSLLEIYRRFMQRHLDRSSCYYECIEGEESTCGVSCRVRSFHVWQAIQLLFPETAKSVVNRVSSFNDLSDKVKLAPTVLVQAVNPGNQKALEFSHRTFAEYLVAEYLAETVSHIRMPPRECKRSVQELLLADIFLFEEPVVAYFLNAFVAQERTLEINLSVEIRRAPRILSISDVLTDPISLCVEHDCAYLLRSLTRAKTSSNRWTRRFQSDFWTANWWVLQGILEKAVESCSVLTVQVLTQFYRRYYAPSILRKCLFCITRFLCKRADYELALVLADTLVTVKSGLLYECLEDTYDLSIAQVEKRLAIAQLFLAKRGSLITEAWKDLPDPLFTSGVHLKCFQFLIDNGAEVRGAKDGDTFLQCAAQYMQQAEIFQLCRSVFMLRPIQDLVFLLSRHNLDFRFPFRRTRVLVRALHLISTKALTGSEEQFELIWQAGKKPFDDASSRAELLKVLCRPKLLKKLLQGYLNLFEMAVREGDVVVTDVLLNLDGTLLEKELDERKNTPVRVAVENKQVAVFQCLVSRGANIFTLNKLNHTVLHVAAETKDCHVFHRVVEVVANQQGITKSGSSKAEDSFSIPELFNMATSYSLETPLHMVCYEMDNLTVEALDLFLSCGTPSTGPFFSSINAPDSNRETALTIALKKGRSLELVKLLVEHGASWLHEMNQGSTVAHICAVNGLLEHLKYFVELGCDVNALDWARNNALQAAIMHPNRERSEVCLFLIGAGVNKWNRNRQGRTALGLLRMVQWDAEEVLKHFEPDTLQQVE